MATQLIKGNAAAVAGALYAGCDCYFGYPITPASEILHEASQLFPRLGRKFVQAESEEAAINMVYGAASTGHRVMTASSGPGISLKQEAISYIAAAELPCVIVDIMRAGPGLGNIGPEQGDYFQVVKGGGHGCYKCIVLAPNSVQEMCDMTIKAFDLAHKYRTPVYVLADAVLGQMIEPIKFPDFAITPQIDESWAVSGTKNTRKNLITSIFLDFDKLEELNIRLQEKYRVIQQQETDYDTFMADDADILIVAYGIVSRMAVSAVEVARKDGIKAGLFRPKTLFPFPDQQLKDLVGKRNCKVLVAELSSGQLIEDVRLTLGSSHQIELINRYGGNLIAITDMAERIKAMA
ncbi:MAG: 3-methyl-2-oxobutanoate dehydrogenase subunit VorB [Sedimentisphaerales bacterium]|nr:3-methyl-2-oxobutanoate dehydrogenase subunit VorB [Sedimentisphaerales bacterium]MBN2842301.1 3-methyl-2-oxobutanoate dehydrogenase subunit VorB [Sedimentisphaerales bacterium]